MITGVYWHQHYEMQLPCTHRYGRKKYLASDVKQITVIAPPFQDQYNTQLHRLSSMVGRTVQAFQTTYAICFRHMHMSRESPQHPPMKT